MTTIKYNKKNSAKAIILREGMILLLKKQLRNGDFIYTLPGGTQNAGESLQETVVREVLEEIAAPIDVRGMLAVYEHNRASDGDDNKVKHKVEFAFLCDVDADYTPVMGSNPDPNQVAVEWVSLDRLPGLAFDPANFAQILDQASEEDSHLYHGYHA